MEDVWVVEADDGRDGGGLAGIGAVPTGADVEIVVGGFLRSETVGDVDNVGSAGVFDGDNVDTFGTVEVCVVIVDK